MSRNKRRGYARTKRKLLKEAEEKVSARGIQAEVQEGSFEQFPLPFPSEDPKSLTTVTQGSGNGNPANDLDPENRNLLQFADVVQFHSKGI